MLEERGVSGQRSGRASGGASRASGESVVARLAAPTDMRWRAGRAGSRPPEHGRETVGVRGRSRRERDGEPYENGEWKKHFTLHSLIAYIRCLIAYAPCSFGARREGV